MTNLSGVTHRPNHKAFEFTGTTLNGRHLQLRYALRGGPDPDIEFEEHLYLPSELPAPSPNDPVVQRLIDACHRVFGVSYFKAAVPREIIANPVPAEDAAFWDSLYTIGMGEFYYRNNIDPRERVQFPSTSSLAKQAEVESSAVRPAEERVLVLIGGGKDSAVAAEIVKHSGVAADAMSLGESHWISASADAAELQLFTIHRQMDTQLFELNRHGAWNGHIPISACIAFVSLLVGYAAGYTDIIVGNENGADEGNLFWNGLLINHQWSKSLHFERALQEWCKRNNVINPNYFSVVRPLNEMAIAEAFSRYPAHFNSFTSCNANFRQQDSKVVSRWCGRCPKCVFVQLMLRPHLDETATQSIFGMDFLADPANVTLIEELTGVRAKPWECVGTSSESRLALSLLERQGRLDENICKWIDEHRDLFPEDVDSALSAMLRPRDDHCLPTIWQKRLQHAYIRSDRQTNWSTRTGSRRARDVGGSSSERASRTG